MHLKLSAVKGNWYAAELATTQRLGFGTYQWQLIGRIDQLDPNVVLGLFTYPTADVGPESARSPIHRPRLLLRLHRSLNKWPSSPLYPFFKSAPKHCNALDKVFALVYNEKQAHYAQFNTAKQFDGSSGKVPRLYVQFSCRSVRDNYGSIALIWLLTSSRLWCTS